MPEVIKAKVVQTKNTVALARWLLGKVLVTTAADGSELRARICETEAYHGVEDLACHASKGRTTRTDVMFAEGGVWYVYLCYGVHEMLNLVTGPAGQASAILIRGVEGVVGPGRVTRAFGIDRRFNRQAVAPESGLWLEDDGFVVRPRAIMATPRIGVAYAGPVWAAKPWRFFYKPEITSSEPANTPRARRARSRP